KTGWKRVQYGVLVRYLFTSRDPNGEADMGKYVTGLAMTAALLAAGVIAAPVLASKAVTRQAGSLIVFDEGKLFSAGGIDKAKSAMSGTQFDHGLTMTIDTYAKIPDAKKGAYSEANKDKIFKDWAKELATGDKARGIYEP